MYLVTGGSGFIGSHLVRALVRRGERVRVMDADLSGGRLRLPDVFEDVEWIEGDVRDEDVTRQVCRGVEVVLHHAAIASVPDSVKAPALTHATNATGTLNVLTAARDAGVRRAIFASSSAVYGEAQGTAEQGALSETVTPSPLSPYGAQKLLGEAYCHVWQRTFGLETVALRYFNVYGLGQREGADGAVVARFLAAVAAHAAITIDGDGEQSRDFVYVGDVVEANLRAASAESASGRVLNVGTGRAVAVNELVNELERVIGHPISRSFGSPRVGDIRRSIADVTALRETLGFVPGVSLAEGLALTVAGMPAMHVGQAAPILDEAADPATRGDAR